MDYARRFLQGLYGGTPKNKKNEPPKNKKNEPITLRKLLNNNDSNFLANIRQIMYSSCGSRQRTARNNVQVCKPLRITVSQNSSKGTPLVIRNKTVESLDPGSYLFLIKYNKISKTFSIVFSPLTTRQELMTRHAFMGNLQFKNYTSNFIVASGELQKAENGTVKFNLESGTFMFPLMEIYKKYGLDNNNVKNMVKNVFRYPANYTSNILTPNKNSTLNELTTTPGVSIKVRGTGQKMGVPLKNLVNFVRSKRKPRSEGTVDPRFIVKKRVNNK